MIGYKTYRVLRTIFSFCLAFMIVFPLTTELARSDRVSDKDISIWMDEFSGYAIGGYDPVSFFTRRKAVLGYDEYQYDYKDIYWKFENSGNREAFKRHPYVYRPQFSGYDPFALAKNRTIQGLPTVWAIHENRLYFFHNIINRRLWLDQKDEVLRKAALNWPKLSKKLISRIELE